MGKMKFAQYGKSRAWMSDLLPHHHQIADELTFIKTMNTEAINHDPAVTFFQTGNQQAGRPSIGSWVSYGLGSDNKNLPNFCVLLSRSNSYDQPLYAKLWGNGFLPSEHQGVMFRSGKDPVLYLNNPENYLLKIGKILRKLSLDELPNLINIIKGDMVFVGPRPALYNQDDLMTLRVATGVDKLKPGITGWAQINGRDDISIEKKVQFEQEYMYRRSTLFDIEIIIKTFTNVLFSKGVSH
jgi:hypothetical protein